MNPLFLRKNPTGSAKASPLIGFFTNFWKLADANDAIGGITLTQSATPVDFTAGKIGNGGNFDRTPKALRANPAFGAGSITICGWFKSSNAASNQYIFNYANNGGSNVTVRLDGGVLIFGIGAVAISSGTTLNDGNWHLFVAYHDTTSTFNTLIIDNGTPVVSGAASNAPAGAQTLGIGSFVSISNAFPANLQFIGMLDAIGVAGQKIPNATQISAIWNGGAGYEP